MSDRPESSKSLPSSPTTSSRPTVAAFLAGALFAGVVVTVLGTTDRDSASVAYACGYLAALGGPETDYCAAYRIDAAKLGFDAPERNGRTHILAPWKRKI